MIEIMALGGRVCVLACLRKGRWVECLVPMQEDAWGE